MKCIAPRWLAPKVKACSSCSAAMRNAEACEEQKRRGPKRQGKHFLPRRGGEHRATGERGDDEAYRAPEADAPVIQPIRAGDRKGNGIAERHQRRLRRQSCNI